MEASAAASRAAVFIPAYNAAAHLGAVLERIPAGAWEHISSVFIVNDGSTDDTAGVAADLAERYPQVAVLTHGENRGYGHTVRTGLAAIRELAPDFAVCLHGDGQYPPEKLPEMLDTARREGFDILQGSRHLDGTARQGGMPLYKYYAGKMLTAMENAVFGLHMTDYHSGYLLYSRKAYMSTGLERLSGSFDFDLEVIASARAAGLKIGEIAIPTRYADEVSYLNPVTYGLRVLGVMIKYVTGRYR